MATTNELKTLYCSAVFSAVFSLPPSMIKTDVYHSSYIPQDRVSMERTPPSVDQRDGLYGALFRPRLQLCERPA